MIEWHINERQFYIREAQSGADYEEVEQIQREAWGFDDIDIVPGDMLVASQHAGGILLGAFEGERMIGFAFGFPALEDGALSIHSHMLAVRSEVRNMQAGFHLKFAQRDRALEMGINEITWTFDPLQSLNAHLNFAKLAVISRRYFVNFYGEETSSPLHQGFGTDRLWVNWHLASDHVKDSIERLKASATAAKPELSKDLDVGNPVAATVSHENAPFTLAENAALLVHAENHQPYLTDSWRERLSGAQCFIEIPHNINALKADNPALGRAWRETTRLAFQAAIEAGFTVSDFFRATDKTTGGEPMRWLYILSR